MTTLAVSVLALPACSKGGGADAVKLIPDSAEMIFGVNPKAVTGSDVYKTYSEKIPDDGLKKATTALEGCNLSIDSLDALVVGVSMDENATVVVSGKGIGNKENVVCLIDKMAEESGSEEKAEVTSVDGKDVVEQEDGRVYLVNENTIAFATKGWQDAVAELIDGKGKPATENSLKDLYGKADTKAAVWMLGNVPADVAKQAEGMAKASAAVKSFVGKIDLSSGFGLELIAVFADDAGATEAATELTALVEQFGPMAGEEMAGVVKSVKIEASGSDLNLSVAASMDDIAAGAKMAGM